MLTPRKIVMVRSWPDPLIQERLEEVGFFYFAEHRTWVRFADAAELDAVTTFLDRQQLEYKVEPAVGRGQTWRMPKLSDDLVLPDGGSAGQCGLCGRKDVPCRQWIEGDDTDSLDYPEAARFYLCGECVQTRMQPHPRLYSPVDDLL